MITIGFSGTAKNTGKTTTALKILDLCYQHGIEVALTSIGYDGENRDNVTGLPKPKFHLREGTIFATAEDCLPVCNAGYRKILVTEIHTPLGRVVLARTTSPGDVLVAGPNRTSDILKLQNILLQNTSVQVTLLDGALNRLVPMIASDGIIISTGAALEKDIPTLVRHTRAVMTIQNAAVSQQTHNGLEKITLISDSDIFTESISSLLSQDTARLITMRLSRKIRELIIPGACDPLILRQLIQQNDSMLENSRIIFGSPLKLLASGKPIQWMECFTAMSNQGITPAYLDKIPIRLITVNPFYPAYNQETGTYSPAYVSKEQLLCDIQTEIHEAPVVDIMQPPLPDLLHICKIRNGRN